MNGEVSLLGTSWVELDDHLAGGDTDVSNLGGSHREVQVRSNQGWATLINWSDAHHGGCVFLEWHGVVGTLGVGDHLLLPEVIDRTLLVCRQTGVGEVQVDVAFSLYRVVEVVDGEVP